MFRDLADRSPAAREVLQTLLSGFHATAEKKCRKALAADPDNIDLTFVMGYVRASQRNWDGAVETLSEVLRRIPDHADAHFTLGKVLVSLGRLPEAVDHFLAALAIKPDPDSAISVSTMLVDMGRLPEGIDTLRRAVAQAPDHADLHSTLIVRQILLPDLSLDEMHGEIDRWRQRHGRRLGGRPSAPIPANSPDPGRPLRIGYVSGYLSQYSPSGLWLQLLPILQRHDPRQVEISIYGDGIFDAARLGPAWPLARSWRSLDGLSDEDAARLIRDDGIDILVCLLGHTGGDRMGLFTYRAAPVQVSFHGMFTSGVAEMDYWLGDPVATPVDSAEKFDETLLRLPHLFCFAPIAGAPPVTPPPSIRQGGRITFGCFNQTAKISPSCVSAMAEVLKAVPDSVLVLKSRNEGPASGSARSALAARFAAAGIEPDRLRMLAQTPSQNEHLACYGNIDIALDSFPYSGCLTSYDALWMGVPVIALGGADRFVYRMSEAVLRTAGLDRLVADSPDDYVAKAVALAQAPTDLAALRDSLRHTVATSPLGDAEGFTRSLEAAYRRMWWTWCAHPAAAK